MASFDLDLVRHALETAQDHGFSEVELGVDGASFRAKFEPGHLRGPISATTTIEAKLTGLEIEAKAIKSTLVGFFHSGPVQLRVGDKVAKGDVVGVINALGIANDLESPVSGEIIEVLVNEDQPVEFGQVLAKVKG